MQGVPRHTQYLALHLVKTMFIPEKFGVRYLVWFGLVDAFHIGNPERRKESGYP